MGKFKYIFFDLDGTLIDIKGAQNAAIKDFYNVNGFDKKVELSEFIKKWDELTEYHYAFYSKKMISYEEQRKRRIEDLYQAFDLKMEKSPLLIYDDYLRYFENNWKVFDDVIVTIQLLKNKGYILGLISNGQYNQQVQKMKKVGIYDYFTYIDSSSEYGFSKPDKRIFQQVFNKYGIQFNDICYVGDSYEKDILPCREIGVNAILINRKNKPYNDSELIEINNLKKLFNYI